MSWAHEWFFLEQEFASQMSQNTILGTHGEKMEPVLLPCFGLSPLFLLWVVAQIRCCIYIVTLHYFELACSNAPAGIGSFGGLPEDILERERWVIITDPPHMSKSTHPKIFIFT